MVAPSFQRGIDGSWILQVNERSCSGSLDGSEALIEVKHFVPVSHV